MEKDAGREGEENVKFISRVESSSRILKYLIHLSLRKRSWKLGDARDSLASSTTSFRESHGIFESITTSTRAPRSYYIKFLFLSRSEWLLFFFLEEEGLFEGQKKTFETMVLQKKRERWFWNEWTVREMFTIEAVFVTSCWFHFL